MADETKMGRIRKKEFEVIYEILKQSFNIQPELPCDLIEMIVTVKNIRNTKGTVREMY